LTPIFKYSFTFKAMGSPCAVFLYAPAKIIADQAFQSVLIEVQRLERKYSRYLSDSFLSKINADAGIQQTVVDDETAGLLDYAQVCYEQSGGLFDITSGILSQIWDFKSARLPTQSQLDEVLHGVGWEKVHWQSPVLFLPHQKMALDFGGIVKEYAVDVLVVLLQQQQISDGLVDLGGDIRAFGQQQWSVGLRHPVDPLLSKTIQLSQGAIASSGNYERCIRVNGQRYGHILNPKTGWSVESLIAVSIVADVCVLAGSASSIAMLKSEQEGKLWLQELGLPYFSVDQKGRIETTL
jgi:FAD:protein FMN transferase